MTMEDLRTLPKTKQQLQDEIKEYILELTAQRNEIEVRYGAAVKAEDREKVVQARAELDIINRKLSAACAEWENPKKTYPVEEITETWNDFAEKYNKNFDAKYKAYLKKRKELAEQFSELVIMQREALRDSIAVKSMITGTVGELSAELNLYPPLPDVLELNTIKHRSFGSLNYYGAKTDLDAAFFAENHDLTGIGFHAANQTIALHIP